MKSSDNSKPSKELIDDLTQICIKYGNMNFYRGMGYFAGNYIPRKKLANARSGFPIPRTEKVIALLDTTVFGKCDRGLAIGVNGIYWRNPDCPTSKTFISWKEFGTIASISTQNNLSGKLVELGAGMQIQVNIFDEHTPKLLQEIRFLFRDSKHNLIPRVQQIANISEGPVITSSISPNSKQFIAQLTKICASYSGNRYFVGELIPKDKLINAHSNFLIPQSEQVIAVADTTIWGKCDCGLAIGVSGIYWRNGAYAPTIKTDLLWEEFAAISIEQKEHGVIQLGQGNAVYVPADTLDGKMVELLLEIKSFVKNNSPTQTSSEQWFITSSGQQFGPYDLSTIESMIASNQINPDECFSWKEGMENWLPFRDVPELQALVQKLQSSAKSPPPLPGHIPPPPPPFPDTTSLDDVLPNTSSKLKESNESVEGELVDLNNASLEDLLTLPGINLKPGEELIKERDYRLGFENVEQVGHFLELQPHQVERLKKKAVLNPYKGQGSKRVTSARKRVIDF